MNEIVQTDPCLLVRESVSVLDRDVGRADCVDCDIASRYLKGKWRSVLVGCNNIGDYCGEQGHRNRYVTRANSDRLDYRSRAVSIYLHVE